MATKDIWAVLEESAPPGCEAVQNLYKWSMAYDAGKGPFLLFTDLCSLSEETFGEDTCYDFAGRSLGYVELGKLAEALVEYANSPRKVTAHVETLVAAEAGELDDDEGEAGELDDDEAEGESEGEWAAGE